MPTRKDKEEYFACWLPPTRQEEREPETHNGNPPEPLSFILKREGGR